MGRDELTPLLALLQERHGGGLARDHAVVPEQPGLRPALRPHQERVRQRLCLFLLRVLHLPLLLPGKSVPITPKTWVLGWFLPGPPRPLVSPSPWLGFVQRYEPALLKPIYHPGDKIPLIPKETI